ncbi:MAG: MgtC/SapB family protein [Acidimicrobiales bacterium]
MAAPSWIVGAAAPALPHIGRGDLTVRLLVALGLTYAIGFEREVRGSTAGNRTFALVGVGAAVVAFLATNGAPNALAGVITGIGFLGAGVIIHEGDSGSDTVRGVTTAATIFASAAVGAAAGQGALLLAGEAALVTLVVLEIRHSRVLRILDGRYWASRFSDDPPMHMTDAERDGHPPDRPIRPEADGTD